MKAHDVKRVKDLELENAPLTPIVADKKLENLARREVAKGGWLGPSRRRRAVEMLQELLGL